ncbi:MAG: cob(I)yrinic acid a,c-diamide adenosyltransferase [Flavobacteriaceae bacterium]
MLEMKVYTRTGDDGKTSLFSGKRVPKHDLRITSYGTIDELNSWVGAIRDHADQETKKELIVIQNDLMTIGAQLANDRVDLPIPKIEQNHVQTLEKSIDRITEQLPPLKNFVIPGGHPQVSNTHLARCVCRRAERYITELKEVALVDPEIIFYVNRLSDYFFTLARKFTQDLNIKEIKWEPTRK